VPISLSGEAGLAGNLWLAVMIGFGAPQEVLDELPAQLELPYVTVDVQAGDEVRVTISGTEHAPSTRWAEMLRRVSQVDAPYPIRADATAVLHWRKKAERGTPADSDVYSGEAFADTLIDVVGGVWLWHLLRRPRVHLRAPLEIGASPPVSVHRLLTGVPTQQSSRQPEVTTPTGAALLGAAYCPGHPSGLATHRISAPATFSDRGLVPELRAWWHE